MKKQCSKCKRRKLLSEFRKRAASKGGLCSKCKSCIRKYDRLWRQQNPEKVKEYAAFWRHQHPEKTKKLTEKWRKQHLEKDRETKKKYRQTDRGKQIHRKSSEKYRRTLNGCLRIRFRGITRRCNNPKAANYDRYGGRGVRCLFKSADEFVNYVVNELKINPHGLQIDRINNDGHYEPGNIRFVTAKVNANNRRRKKF